MNILVTYVSKTGNTKKIAESIYRAIPEPKELKEIKDVDNTDNYDLVFVGFPIHSWNIQKIAKKFIDRKLKNKQIAIFYTHAIPKNNYRYPAMVKTCINSVKESKLVGFFTCQGEIVKTLGDFMRSTGDPELIEFIDNAYISDGRPNKDDFQDAAKFANEIIKQI